jgi:hypothetical protein
MVLWTMTRFLDLIPDDDYGNPFFKMFRHTTGIGIMASIELGWQDPSKNMDLVSSH